MDVDGPAGPTQVKGIAFCVFRPLAEKVMLCLTLIPSSSETTIHSEG